MNNQLYADAMTEYVVNIINREGGKTNMATLKEEAQNYVPSKTKNIAELETVSVDAKVMEESGETSEGKTYSYKYIEINGEKYRIPKSVLDGLQTMLKEKPNMLHFKVSKKGEGMKTEYAVIPL